MTKQPTAVTKDDINRVNSQHSGMEYSKVNAKQKGDKTFEELVEESIRLPELSPSSHLPMTMTEILRTSKPAKDITTKLPQIHNGQVQLVTTKSDGFSSERKRRRGKKTKAHHRPERQSPRAVPEISSNNVRVPYSKPTSDLATKGTNAEQSHWKKKIHRRHSKRNMAEEGDPLNVSITVSGCQHYK